MEDWRRVPANDVPANVVVDVMTRQTVPQFGTKESDLTECYRYVPCVVHCTVPVPREADVSAIAVASGSLCVLICY